MPQSGRVRRRWLVKSVNRAGTAALGWRIVVAIIALAALRSPAAGEPVGVDLQLVIAIDVSASMNESRRRVQREGYARAIRSAEVLAAIKSGPHGRIAIACFGWARPDYQRVIAPWTIVETRADAEAVAHAIEKEPLASEGGTSISAALLFSERLLHAAGIRADRKIIDVSGDGPNNSGPLLRLVSCAKRTPEVGGRGTQRIAGGGRGSRPSPPVAVPYVVGYDVHRGSRRPFIQGISGP